MNYLEINDAATHQVKLQSGTLQNIVVNDAGTSWTLQIFDGWDNTGTAMAGGTAFTIPAAGSVLRYNATFAVGLTIITSGTPGSITVSYD